METKEKKKKSWRERIVKITNGCLLRLRSVERACERFSKLLERWAFLDIMEHLGRLAVLVAVILFFTECDDRRKTKQYQAWQVINSAHDQKSSGGRIDALQDLVKDGVSLKGIDISNAILPRIELRNANLAKGNLSEAYLAASNFSGANLGEANLFRTNLFIADLSETNLCEANLSGAVLLCADLSGAYLLCADLSGAHLSGMTGWRQIKSIKHANIYAVKYPPDGFIQWAKEHGAVEYKDYNEWQKYIKSL